MDLKQQKNCVYKSINILIIGILCFFFICCGESTTVMDVPPPKTVFNNTVKKRTVNLENHIGKELLVYKSIDTVLYSVLFDKQNRTNTIVKNNKDTIFCGTANKYGSQIFLNNKLSSGKYRIHVISISDSTIIGLESEFDQLYKIDSEIIEGKYSEYQVDTQRSFELSPDKKGFKQIFSTKLSDIETYNIIELAEEWEYSVSKEKINKEFFNDTLNSSKIISKIYPNPVVSNLNIAVNSSVTPHNYNITADALTFH